jgi:hypothetical protein
MFHEQLLIPLQAEQNFGCKDKRWFGAGKSIL